MLEDDKDKKLPASRVFSLAIQYLKDDLISTCLDRLKKSNMTLDDIELQWVLTVPAIWNDAAKQFMREAAEAVTVLTYNMLETAR